jgi:hypothetical protein
MDVVKNVCQRLIPGFISTMRPNLTQPTHQLEKKDTLRGILFLRLQASHLRPKDRVLNGSHYVLLGTQGSRICMVSRCCDGMVGMLEASSPRT